MHRGSITRQEARAETKQQSVRDLSACVITTDEIEGALEFLIVHWG
jgi:hypothetical protein